jgi:hypothetical protein
VRRIFICYRREDSSGHAGRLYDRLEAHFGDDDVFMDIEAIEPGADYLEVIDRTVASVDVLIVLIGKRWLGTADPAGSRRLDDPEDVVRLEVAAALTRNIRVFPVLVQGATMPHPSDLPPDLAGLTRRNAIEISDARWDFDAERLIHAIEGIPGRRADAPPRERRPEKPSSEEPSGASLRLPLVLAIVGLFLLLLWGALLARNWHNELWGIRAGAAALSLAVGSIGLWRRRWLWVVVAGILGLVGLSLWLIQLQAQGHTSRDLISPSTDGIPNIGSLLGALLVLVAGVLGTRAGRRS